VQLCCHRQHRGDANPSTDQQAVAGCGIQRKQLPDGDINTFSG
jgi:hypothetical protein